MFMPQEHFKDWFELENAIPSKPLQSGPPEPVLVLLRMGQALSHLKEHIFLSHTATRSGDGGKGLLH